jgi:hypothetical protein
LYYVWGAMHDRCRLESTPGWQNYKGRGIKVCEEWADFAVFRDWAVIHGYHEGLDLNRIDNDGNYTPDNCNFITRRENSWNRRSSRRIEAWGETKAVAAWVEDPRCVVSYTCLYQRVARRGWNPEKAISTP